MTSTSTRFRLAHRFWRRPRLGWPWQALLRAGLVLAVGLAAAGISHIPGRAAWENGGQAARGLAVPAALDEQVWRAPVAPGVDLLAVRRLDGDGWLDLFALVVDLDVPGVSVGTLTASALTQRERPSQLARQSSAVAAVNGDFFHLGASEAPVGLVVREGVLWKGPDPSGRPSLAVLQTKTGLVARIGVWRLQSQLVGQDGTRLVLDGFNEPAVRPGQVVLFDERWGKAPLPLTRQWAHELAYLRLRRSEAGAELWDVVEFGRGATAPPGAGEMVALGWRDGAQRLLSAAAVRTSWRWEWRLVPQAGSVPEGRLEMAVSGGGWLVRDGNPLPLGAVMAARAPGVPDSAQPRTAAGVDVSGRRLILAVVDGRRATSRGLHVEELARWMVRLGAWEAIYLDGGGSSTLAVDLNGHGPTVINRPAAGEERAVPVAIGVFFAPPAGAVAPFTLRPASGLPRPELEGYRMPFPGLVAAAGVPVQLLLIPPAPPETAAWSVDPPELGYFVAPGLFVGVREGEGRILAVRTAAVPEAWQYEVGRPPATDLVSALASPAPPQPAFVATIPVKVIGTPVALEVELLPSPSGQAGEHRLRAWLRDEQGRRAPLDPGRVAFWVEGPVQARIEGDRLRVERRWDGGAAVVQARYLHLRAAVPLVGAEGIGAPAAASAASPASSAASSPPSPLLAVVLSTPSPPPPPGDGAGRTPSPRDWGLWLVTGTASLAAEATASSGDPAVGWGAWAPGSRPPAPAALTAPDGTRVLVVNFASRPWAWLQRELQRFVSERSPRLVLVTEAGPDQWPVRREGEMVQAWLSGVAAQGREVWWVYPDPAANQPHSAAVDGVTQLAVPAGSMAVGTAWQLAFPGGLVRPAPPSPSMLTSPAVLRGPTWQ